MHYPPPTATDSVRTGLPGVGAVPWGSHLCHFYRSLDELREPLVEFFRAGLANGEQCLWVASSPLPAAAARQALACAVPDLAELERTGQVTILDVEDWYTKGGAIDREAVVRQWIESEQQALAAGYTGLRLTGNTSWLQPSDWDEFVAYEAAVHEAFHGRRVLALCSYAMSHCTPDDALSVLRNHEFALVRRQGEWSLVRSATELLGFVDAVGPPAGADHRAYFFREAEYPADAVAEFLAQAPAGAALAIAPETHLQAIETALRRRGVDPREVATLAAERLLESVLQQDTMGQLRQLVQQTVQTATSSGVRAHIYGEMVNELVGVGRKAEAIALEEIWNECLQTADVALGCGYDLAHFEDDAEGWAAVCACHTDVRLEASSDRQQMLAQAFMDERTRRKDSERDRAQLLEAERHANARLARLQRITSALSEAVTPEDVAAVSDGAVRLALNAAHVTVIMAGDDGATRCLGVVRSDALRLAAESACESGVRSWLDGAELRAYGTPASVKSLVTAPLTLHGRRVGAVGLAFSAKQSFDSAQRALIEDACSQIGLALERARLYEEAERQRKAAEDAARAKDQFIATLGHELRNPLSALQTAAELLTIYEADPDKLARIRTVLTRQTAHMAKLIEDILDVSRIVWGKIALESRALDLAALVAGVLEDQREHIQRRNIAVVADLGDAPVWVRGDPVRLVQVVDNILSNAVKFTPGGGKVNVTLRRDGRDSMLTIEDTGAGIDPVLLPHIFEPFQQAGQDLARSAGGLGLGLTLVKGLLDLHGGRIDVASAGAGRGCRVVVRLPRSDAAHCAAAPAVRPGAHRRVLIVEDNRDAADLLSELLRLDGHEVAVAYDGEQALEMAQGFGPQLVLCDLGLPGRMNGYDLALALRSGGSDLPLRLVALSGYGSPDDVERARGCGFDQHLTKPVDQDTLRGVFDHL